MKKIISLITIMFLLAPCGNLSEEGKKRVKKQNENIPEGGGGGGY